MYALYRTRKVIHPAVKVGERHRLQSEQIYFGKASLSLSIRATRIIFYGVYEQILELEEGEGD